MARKPAIAPASVAAHHHGPLRLWALLLRIVLSLLALPLLYLLIALVLGLLPVKGPTPSSSLPLPFVHTCQAAPSSTKKAWVDCDPAPEPTAYTVWLVSNGVHINIVLPLDADAAPWKAWLSSMDATHGSWIYIGWGSEAFYTQVPNWSDLTVAIATKALFLDRSVLFARSGPNPQNSAWPEIISLTLTPAQYATLAADIRAQFSDTRPLPVKGDAFYHAHGYYSPLMTCNEWVRQRLYRLGVTVPAWSPFDKPLMWRLKALHTP